MISLVDNTLGPGGAALLKPNADAATPTQADSTALYLKSITAPAMIESQIAATASMLELNFFLSRLVDEVTHYIEPVTDENFAAIRMAIPIICGQQGEFYTNARDLFRASKVSKQEMRVYLKENCTFADVIKNSDLTADKIVDAIWQGLLIAAVENQAKQYLIGLERTPPITKEEASEGSAHLIIMRFPIDDEKSSRNATLRPAIKIDGLSLTKEEIEAATGLHLEFQTNSEKIIYCGLPNLNNLSKLLGNAWQQ